MPFAFKIDPLEKCVESIPYRPDMAMLEEKMPGRSGPGPEAGGEARDRKPKCEGPNGPWKKSKVRPTMAEEIKVESLELSIRAMEATFHVMEHAVMARM